MLWAWRVDLLIFLWWLLAVSLDCCHQCFMLGCKLKVSMPSLRLDYQSCHHPRILHDRINSIWCEGLSGYLHFMSLSGEYVLWHGSFAFFDNWVFMLRVFLSVIGFILKAIAFTLFSFALLFVIVWLLMPWGFAALVRGCARAFYICAFFWEVFVFQDSLCPGGTLRVLFIFWLALAAFPQTLAHFRAAVSVVSVLPWLFKPVSGFHARGLGASTPVYLLALWAKRFYAGFRLHICIWLFGAVAPLFSLDLAL